MPGGAGNGDNGKAEGDDEKKKSPNRTQSGGKLLSMRRTSSRLFTSVRRRSKHDGEVEGGGSIHRDTDPMASVKRRDAFLSGPLHGRDAPVEPLKSRGSGTFNSGLGLADGNVATSGGGGVHRTISSKTSGGDAMSLESLAEEEEPMMRPRFVSGVKSKPAVSKTKRKFRNCLMRTLRPAAFQDDPDAVLQAKAVACTSGGELVIAGGSYMHPGDKVPRGWVAVWEQDKEGEGWRQWATGLDVMDHPVNDIAVLGNMLVIGHSYLPLVPDGGQSISRASSTGTAFGQDRESGYISLWYINGLVGMLQFCHVRDTDIHSCDPAGVTAVRWLSLPADPSDANPPDNCIVVSASLSGTISLFKYCQRDRSLYYWKEYCEPKQKDGLTERSRVSDLSFLNRMDSEDDDMLLAVAYWNQKAVWILSFSPGNAEKPLEQKACLSHSREVQSVRFRKTLGMASKGDADVLLTACMDYSLRMWDIDNNRVIRILQNSASHFTTCDFSFQGHMISAGCQSGELMIFDTITGLKMRTMAGHTDVVNKVMLLPGTDGGMLASASNDGSVRIWELKSKENAILCLGADRSESTLSTVYALAFCLNQSRVVTVHRDCSMRLWSTAEGELTYTVSEHQNFVFGIDVHPTEHIAATAGHDGTVKLWNLDLGICFKTFDSPEGVGQGEAEVRQMSAVAFHPSGDWLAAGCFDKRVYLYTRERASSDLEWRPRCCWHAHSSRVWAVAFSGDGIWMASGAWDNSVMIYRVTDIELPFLRKDGSENMDVVPEIRTKHIKLDCGANVWAVVFQPKDDEYVNEGSSLVATGSADSILRIWTCSGDEKGAGEWRLYCMLKGHTNTVTDIAWHPTGDMLVSSSFDKTVRLWGRCKSGFVSFGIWAAYSSPTMAVGWGYQDLKAMDAQGSMIAISTMEGLTYLMDATDAGQRFVPFGRAKHILENAGAGATAAISDIFHQSPQTLTSLGPQDSGIFLLWGIISKSQQDKSMLPMLLDSAQKFCVSPLLPYSPQNVAVLTLPDYQLVAAIVDTIISMHEGGDMLGIELLSTGYGTLSILQLIKNYPDQAVVMLNHFGMTKCDEDVYGQKWTPHQVLTDGVKACTSTDPEITLTRVPEKLWNEGEVQKVMPQVNWGSTVHAVATHATFPHITGMPLEEWYQGGGPFSISDNKSSRLREGKNMLDFDELESSFLHVAYNSQDPLLFDTALGRAIVQYKWRAYGRDYFAAMLGLYFMQLCASTWQAITWGHEYRRGGCDIVTDDCIQCTRTYISDQLKINSSLQCECLPHDMVCPRVPNRAAMSGIFVLTIAGLQVLFELYQMCILRKRYFRKFLRSSWNSYEVVVILLLMASGICTVVESPPIQVVPPILSLATFGCWFKLLYFARAFTVTGGLVRLIRVIVTDMSFMFVVLAIGLISGALGFWALPPNQYFADDSLVNHIDNPWDMFFFVFSIMVSAYEVSYFTNWFSKFCVLFFLFIQSVVLLNALIALMSDTCEKVKENIKIVALHERAGMMLEMELVLGRRAMLQAKQRPRWLHALVQHKDISGSKDKGGGGGGMGAMVPSSSGIWKELNDMQENISQLAASHEQILEKLDALLSKQQNAESKTSVLPQKHTKTIKSSTSRGSSFSRSRSNSLGNKDAADASGGNESDSNPEAVASPRAHRLSVEDVPVPGLQANSPAPARKHWLRLRAASHMAGVLASRSRQRPPLGPSSLDGSPDRSRMGTPDRASTAPRSMSERIRHLS